MSAASKTSSARTDRPPVRPDVRVMERASIVGARPHR